MSDDNVVHVDLRPIGSDRHPADDWRALIPPHLRAAPPDGERGPPTDWMAPPTDEGEPGVFPTLLLTLGIAFALIGAARLAWNVYEAGWEDPSCSWCGFYGFFILDRSMPYFAAFGLFAIAAGVWRRRD